MSVPSRKTTEVVSLEKKRNGQYLVKAGSFSFLLDENAFTDFYLYPGKELSDEEIKALDRAAKSASISSYAYSLLGKKRYSEAEMKDKLMDKFANEEAISKLLNDLIQYKLIDDEAYAKDYKEEKENALFGKIRIKEELRYKRKVPAAIVDALSFPNEKENAEKYLQSISRAISSYPYLAKKKKAHDILLRRGFTEEAIAYALKGLEKDDKDKILQRMEIEAARAYTRYQRKYEGKELRARVYSSLYKKGYESEDIASCLERIENEH